MSSGYRQAVERHARLLRDELIVCRQTRLVAPESMARDVLVRLRQLLAGDETPLEVNPDD